MDGRHAAIAGIAVVLFTLSLGCTTPADVKPAQHWDQAAVTTLSSELVSHVGNAATAANERAVRPDQMESVSAYLDNLRVLERQCRKLSSRRCDPDCSALVHKASVHFAANSGKKDS